MNESETLVAAQNIIEHEISSTSGAVKLFDQLDKMKKTCQTKEKTYEREDFRLMEIAAQHISMQQETVDTFAHTSGAVV